MLMGGVLPFGAIFIELYFIMNSIWGNKVYYLFGFAALVFIILTITCSEVTILLCYFHLCAEVSLNISIFKCDFQFIYLSILYILGLSLVVESFPNIWSVWIIYIHLFYYVFRNEVTNYIINKYGHIFWMVRSYEFNVLRSYGYVFILISF